MPNYGDAELIVAPVINHQHALIREANEFDVNIFSGISAYPLVRRAFSSSLRGNSQVGIMSEAGDWFGLGGGARLLRARIQALRYQRHISFILAIGHLGERWFRLAGYPHSKIFRYGYFVDRVELDKAADVPLRSCAAPYKIAFVGQLVRGKRVNTLICALARIRDDPWLLEVIGDGNCALALRRLTHRLGIADRVTFRGALENAQAMAALADADLLVLPSRYDGWGAVVNEALLQGVPVVCSDRCGAADLLNARWRGQVFRAGAIGELEQVLRSWISKGKISASERARLISWSHTITGDSAAAYLIEVIRSAATGAGRPTPPWLSGTSAM